MRKRELSDYFCDMFKNGKYIMVNNVKIILYKIYIIICYSLLDLDV